MSIPETGVWYYKESDTDELKYSMRSAIQNLGLKRVILVGDCPKWFVPSLNAIYVPSVMSRNDSFTRAWVPWQHMQNFIRSGVHDGEFLLFNDDFFILQPITEWVDFHRDPIDYEDRVAKSNRIYNNRERRALISLGIDPNKGYHYNMHIPMRMHTDQLKQTLMFWNSLLNKDVEFRTTYGNMHLKDTPEMVDVKYRPNEVFFSGGDRWWKMNGDSIKRLFPDKTFVER